MSKFADKTENINLNDSIDFEDGVNTEKYILKLQTIQANEFRILIEALKDILNDINIEFTPDGIKIITVDGSQTVLVHLKLFANKFESYFCKHKIIIGVNMTNFYRLIKTMSNDDILTLYILENDISHLGMIFENSKLNTIWEHRLKTFDMNDESFGNPTAEFSSIITLPSNVFQKIIRDMNSLLETVEIISVKNQLIFRGTGDYSDNKVTICENSEGMTFIQNEEPDEIVQGYYSLKELILFTKCTNLCPSIELYLKNNFPIIVKYTVGDLGEIKLALTPKDSYE